MINIEKIQPEIIDRLKPLNLDKVILFGSYAYGTPNSDSDIDLYLLKDEEEDDVNYDIEAQFKLGDLMKKYKIGFDIIYSTSNFLTSNNEPFYKIDILEKGKVLYAK